MGLLPTESCRRYAARIRQQKLPGLFPRGLFYVFPKWHY
nr:MAG TPA: hypothetical protein [Caudoviricetes sp.]